MKIYYNSEMEDQPFPVLASYKVLVEKPKELADINKIEGTKLATVESGAMNLANHDSDELPEGATNKYLLDLAVTEIKLAAQAVSYAKIAVGAIHDDVIAAAAITETKVASDAISTPKIQAGAITAVKIAVGAVIAEKIYAGAVTSDKIYAGAVTADKINVSSLAAISANLGTVTAGSINASQVTITNLNADNISVGILSADRIYQGSVPITKLCAGTTPAGGTFWFNGTLKGNIINIGASSSGNFIIAPLSVGQVYIGEGGGYDILPYADNYGQLGYSNRRWSTIYCATQNAGQHITGDLNFKFKNKIVFRIKEDPNFLNFYNQKGQLIMKLSQKGELYVKKIKII